MMSGLKMISMRCKYSKIRSIIIPAISVFVVDYIAFLERNILRYNSSCKPLPMPPFMISGVLKRGKIAGCRAKVLSAIPPYGSGYLRWLATKITLIFNLGCSILSFAGIYSFLSQYLPDLLPRYASQRSDLRGSQMLDGGQHHYILWSQASFNGHGHSPFSFGLRYDKVNIL